MNTRVRSEVERESGDDKSRRMQFRLAVDLRQELQLVDEKRQEILSRVERYASLGLLSAEHLALIHRKKHVESSSVKKMRTEAQEATNSHVPDTERSIPVPVAATTASSQSSEQFSPQWQERSQSPDNENVFAVEFNAGSPRDVDENIFCTIQVSGDEDESVTSDDTGFQLLPNGITHLTESAKERIARLKRQIIQIHHTSFPRACFLCDTSFCSKKTLLRHILGDAAQGRRPSCPALVAFLSSSEMVPQTSSFGNSISDRGIDMNGTSLLM